MYGDTTTFLIFSVNGVRYAINTNIVQEIMQDTKVHYLPFVPSYIEGIINCHGRPYTVINSLIMFNEIVQSTNIEEKTFLVFKRDDDQFCLHISNIDLFYEAEEDDISETSIAYKNDEVPLLNTDMIEERLIKDLGYEQ